MNFIMKYRTHKIPHIKNNLTRDSDLVILGWSRVDKQDMKIT